MCPLSAESGHSTISSITSLAIASTLDGIARSNIFRGFEVDCQLALGRLAARR